MYLQNAPLGSFVEIVAFSENNNFTKRLNEMGILIGSIFQIVRKAPFNGPIILKHSSNYLALRCTSDFNITVKPV